MHRASSRWIILAALVFAMGALVACGRLKLSAPQRSTAVVTVAPTPTRLTTRASPLTASPSGSPSPASTATHGVEQAFLPAVAAGRPSMTPTLTVAPTSPPPPSPTPTLPWPEPLRKPSRSKLGLHVQWNNSPDIMEFVRRMKPAVVKGVDDLGFLAEVKQVSPSTVTIGRLNRDSQNTEGDPVEAARRYVAQNLEDYKHHPRVDYWEGLNEPGVRGRMTWYATFEVERVRLMAEHGLRSAVGGFSTGVPEWDEMAAFLPALEAAQKYKGIFTLHEYGAPTFDLWVGHGLPGRPSYANRGALALRYRWWYEDFLKPRGLVVPLVISEAGIDGTIGGHPGPKGRGWQDYTGYWGDHGLGRDGIRAYTQQLAWYDSELQKDRYVLGFAVFTAGAMGPDWASYDITGILRHIATWVILPNQ